MDEADRMDVDPAATADEADVPATTTEGSKKKPALKRKASDRGQTTAASTPGPGSVVGGGAGGGGGAAAGVVTGVRTREERFRAVPRGELIRHLYKGLMWDEVEKHAQYGWNEVSLWIDQDRVRVKLIECSALHEPLGPTMRHPIHPFDASRMHPGGPALRSTPDHPAHSHQPENQYAHLLSHPHPGRTRSARSTRRFPPRGRR